MTGYIHEVTGDSLYGNAQAIPGTAIRGDGEGVFLEGVFLYEARPAEHFELTVAEEPADYKIDFVFDKETLTSYFEVILSDNPSAPDCMAQVLVRFKEAIESGEEGIARAIKTLGDGVEMMYERTEVHRAALKLYTLSHLGYVRPQDEPLAVLVPAIERSLAEADDFEKSAKPKKKRRTS